jgi:hypothetical protein
MICFKGSRFVKINLRTTIRYNGQEYSSPDKLPADIRAAYLKATVSESVAINHILDKIVVNGHELATGRNDAVLLYDDIMRVIENNGAVTLPISETHGLTNRQIKAVILLLSAVAAIAVAVVAKVVS